jgi:hypothetical protein
MSRSSGSNALTLPRPTMPEPPRPVCIDAFLSTAECSQILWELQFALWRPSLAYQRQPSGSYQNALNPSFRVSLTAFEQWFTDELKTVITQIESRLQTLFAFEPSHLEEWQATSYAKNGYVDYHLDSGYWEGYFAGERMFTFLIYLTNPTKGGSTHFRALDLDIPGKAGRLVAWHNLFESGTPDHRMIHSGTPLVDGDKTTLVTWVRQKPYRRS